MVSIHDSRFTDCRSADNDIHRKRLVRLTTKTKRVTMQPCLTVTQNSWLKVSASA